MMKYNDTTSIKTKIKCIKVQLTMTESLELVSLQRANRGVKGDNDTRSVFYSHLLVALIFGVTYHVTDMSVKS